MSSPSITSPTATAADATGGRLFAGRLSILLLVCIAQFMLVMDDTIVNVALPSISADLKLDEAALSWVPNAYLLFFGGFLLIGGRVADMYGRRRVFAIAMGAFVTASALCGMAASSEMLIASRALQGLAGAFMSPAALSILLATFVAERERTSALAAWTALTAMGAVAGLLLSGTLVELLDWRWIFWVNLPVGVITLIAATRMIPVSDAERAEAPAVGSAVTATAALLTLVYTVVETGSQGWTSTRTIAGLALAAILAIIFVIRESRSENRLVPASVAKKPHIILANVYMLLAAATLLAMFFFLTLYMQLVLDYSPIEAGLAYLPFSVTLGVSSVLTTKLLERFSALPFLAIGPAVAAVGLYIMSTLDAGSSYAGALMPALMIVSFGFGMAFVPLLGVATAGVPERDSGIASGLVTSNQQIGGAIGIAVMVTLSTTVMNDQLAAGAQQVAAMLDGFSTAFTVQTILMSSAVLVAGLLSLFGREAARIEGQPVMA